MRILKITILCLIVAYCISCGDTNPTQNIEENTSADTTSKQAAEFIEINKKLKANINDPFLYLKRAQIYAKYKDLPSALSDIDRAINIDSLVPEFYLLQAEFLKRQGQFKESKEALDNCMHVDNNNVQARIELAWLSLIAKNHKQSIEYVDEALKRDMYSAEAYYIKGINFTEMGDTVLAISSYKTAVEQDNDYYDAYVALGILYFEQGDPLAGDYYKNALRINPNSIDALYNYGLFCQENEKYDEAITSYKKILETQEYREPYFNLGYIYQEYLNVYDTAIQNYNKAITIDANYYQAYYNKGLCYEALKDYTQAEDNFRKALSIYPEYTYAALSLERVLKN